MDQYLSTVIVAVITGIFSIITLIIQKRQDKVINKIDEQTMFIEKERKLKQVDILNLSLPYCKKYDVKMNKSDISQYVSGKNEPGQEKLVVLGMALGVSEAWLMGLDVPKTRKDNSAIAKEDVDLLWKFSLLEQRDKETILDMINVMLSKSEEK